MQAGLAELLADLHQFARQAAQALALGDFGAHAVGLAGGERAGPLLAVDVVHEAEVGAVAAVARLLAMAVGAAALGVDFTHRAGAQCADGVDAGQDAGAALFEGF